MRARPRPAPTCCPRRTPWARPAWARATCGPAPSAAPPATRTCPSVSWNGYPLRCAPKLCPALAPAQGVKLSGCSGQAHGDVCSTRCGSGLVPRKGRTSRKCVSGLWTGIPLSCGAASCPNLQPPPGFAQPRVPCVGSQTGDVCEMVCGEEGVATPISLANRMRVCVDGSSMGGWAACPGALPYAPPSRRARACGICTAARPRARSSARKGPCARPATTRATA